MEERPVGRGQAWTKHKWNGAGASRTSPIGDGRTAMCDSPIGSGPLHRADRRMSDLDRYVIMRSAGSFKVGRQGQLLVYPITRKRGYIVSSAQAWRRLQVLNAVCLPAGMVLSAIAGLALIALGVKLNVVRFVVTTGVLLSGVFVLAIALFICARFERSIEALTLDEVRSASASISSWEVGRTILVGTLGLAVLGGSVVALQFDALKTAALLLPPAGLTLAYFSHRLFRRSGQPPPA